MKKSEMVRVRFAVYRKDVVIYETAVNIEYDRIHELEMELEEMVDDIVGATHYKMKIIGRREVIGKRAVR